MKKFSIEGKLYFLIFILVVPMLVLQGLRIAGHYKSGIERELKANHDYAEAISVSFTNYLDRIWDAELAMGLMISSGRFSNSDDIGSYLDGVSESQPGVHEYEWIDNNFVIAASSDEKAVGVSLKGFDYVERISRGEEKVVSEVIVSRVYDRPTFVVARAIKKNGELEGIMATTIDLEKLSLVLPTGRTDTATSFGLVDNKGVLVYHNGEEALKSSDSSAAANRGDMSISAVSSYESFEGPQKKDRDIEANMSISWTNWTAYANTSYASVIAGVTGNVLEDIVLLSVLVLASIVAAVNIGRGILEPINVLHGAAQEIAAGNFNVRTKIEGNDEIALAAQAFDRMAGSIEEYDKLKTQFFSTISHELKTPLNIILASTQMINKSCSNGKSESCLADSMKYTGIMRQNCYRLLRLINNLIDINRIDSGFLNINLSRNNIVNVIEEITLSVADYAESRNISLVFDTEVEEKIIPCDPDKIERIMLNLLSNSIKFTNPGGCINVNLHEGKDSIAVSVKDTGIGIPEDKKDIIFERFRQVDSSLHRKYEGSGIGLSLVKALVESHGGNISVKSVEGEGSEFIIELPIGEAAVTEEVSHEEYNSQSLERVHKIDVELADICEE